MASSGSHSFSQFIFYVYVKMTTAVDNLDMSFKYILGRLGIDKTLPWYEENVLTPELIAHESLMTEKVPSSAPSVVQGGKVTIQLNDSGFGSDGKETTNKPVITCLLYTSPSPRDATLSRMPSSA